MKNIQGDENQNLSTATTESPRPALEKVPFPDPAPVLSLQIEAALTCDWDRFSNGSLVMKMDSSDVKMDGKLVGSIANAMGGGISITVGSRHYLIKHKDIFAAVYEADQKVQDTGARNAG